MNSFSIVIPVYNESKNIVTLINEIESAINYTDQYEIIIVNDCSTDNTHDILKQYKNNKKFKILDNKINKGQSSSIFRGIQKSLYDTIVTIDGDCQNDSNDIKNLYDVFFTSDNIKLVSGIRKNRKDSVLKIYSSKIANYFRDLILRDGCKDTGCSLKIFDKKIFLEFPFFNGIHRFLPSLYVGFGYKVIYINVHHRKRLHGKSKYGTFKRLINGVRDILHVRRVIKKNYDWIFF